MAMSLTYDPVLSRIRIAVTGLDARVDFVLFERSPDQVSWTTVRGGDAVPAVAGAADVDDYEFTDGQTNYYRARGSDTAAPTFVAAGAGATGNNASVVPALPAGLLQNDLLLVLASIRNSGTGTPSTPAGYTLLVSAANLRLFGKRAGASESAPTVSFAGGAANADTIAQTAAFRNVELTPSSSNTLLNSSAQNVAYPGLTIPDAGTVALVLGWKQDDWTSVATLAGMTEIGETSSTAGDDSAQAWDYQIQTTAANIPAGSFVVTGGASAISRGAVVSFTHQGYLSEDTASITPALAGTWLKSIARPFLNREFGCVNFGPVTRPSRNGIFEIIGRSRAVAVTDVRSGMSFDLLVTTTTLDDSEHLDLILASGDPLFVQSPAGSPVPTLYAVVGDSVKVRPLRRPEDDCRPVVRVTTLPLTEVAAPDAAVVGATYTWAGVVADYATWSAVIAANATWADLLENVGGAGDVIVP